MNKTQEKIYNEFISQYNFNRQQKEEIIIGLEQGLNVSLYAKPEFDSSQMAQIRLGLEKILMYLFMLNLSLLGLKWNKLDLV